MINEAQDVVVLSKDSSSWGSTSVHRTSGNSSTLRGHTFPRVSVPAWRSRSFYLVTLCLE